MKLISIIAILILFVFKFSYSQQLPKVEVSKSYQVIDAKFKTYQNFGNTLFAIKKTNVQIFDISNMTLNKMFKYSIPENGEIEYTGKIGDKLYVLYSLWDSKNKNEQLFYKEISSDQEESNKEGNLLLKIKGKLSGDMVGLTRFTQKVINKFHFCFSKSQEEILVVYRTVQNKEYSSFNRDSLGFIVFNKNLIKEWGKIVTMPYNNSDMEINEFAVDSIGNAYFVAKILLDNNDSSITKDEIHNYHFELIKIEKESGIVTKTPIAVKGKFISNLWIHEGVDYMYCTGYTNNGIELNEADGIILFKIRKDNSKSEIKYYPILPEILTQYNKDSIISKINVDEKKFILDNQDLEFKKIIYQKDSSIIIIGEQHYIFRLSVSTGSRGGVSTAYKHYYNSLLIIKINKSGELSWIKKLPKFEKVNWEQEEMSYKYLEGNGCHYLLFLDNVNNLKLSLNQSPELSIKGKNGYLTAYKVQDSDGKVEKIPILDLKNINGMEVVKFYISKIIPISISSFLFEVYKKDKEDILVKVTF